MTRAQSKAQWNSAVKPFEMACARNNINAKRKKEQQLRRDTLEALVKKRGITMFFKRGWQKELAKALGVSVLTIHRDMRGVFGYPS